ncbi:MAG: glutamate--tRNA ligase [Nitrospirae bacterium]|nr:glutamate--tRNA ligase [Nitrospirota bacterium]
MTVRVRFAPSPTGYLHIGGVRTALFNYLFARHNKGVFMLRIEDTDQGRSTDESIKAIIDGMHWLGLNWDEGPYRQTERMELYKSHVKRLIDEGNAYNCYCTSEELEERRKQALAEKRIPKYDGRCRTITEPVPDRPHAVRFKAPVEGQIVVNDIVKGRVVYENAQLDDLIIMRSDGWPTYNLCVVVDDADMQISHVIRGDDHLNNTPRQIQLYHAFGYEIPQFAHLPMILGPDKTRLSKRHGATAVTAYEDMGYLPEAMVNYLVRLGWSYKDQEVFSLEELIEKFSLEHVGKSAAVFNPEKLLWLNSHYIAHLETKDIIKRLKPFLVKEGLMSPSPYPSPARGEGIDEVDLRQSPPPLNPLPQGEGRFGEGARAVVLPPLQGEGRGGDGVQDEAWLSKVIISLRERCRTLVEMANAARYFFLDDVEIDPEAAKKFLIQSNKETLELVLKGLEELPNHVLENNPPMPPLEKRGGFSSENIDALFKSIMEAKGVKMGQVAQPLRVALTGRTVSPGIFEVIDILGKEKVIYRLKQAIARLS